MYFECYNDNDTCTQYEYAKGFGIASLTQFANAIYVVLQYFKKRRMAHELMMCAKSVAVFETRGSALGEIFQIDLYIGGAL